MDTKHCSRCGRDLPISEFYENIRGGCKACVLAYNREWYKAHRILKRQPPPAGLKWCNGCGEIKLLSEFYRDKSVKSGYHSHCKKCSDNARKIKREQEKAGRSAKEVIPDGFKRCTKCKLILSVSDFNLVYGKPRFRCRKCEQEYRKQNHEKAKAQQIIWRSRQEVKERKNARRREQRQNNQELRAKERAYRQEYQKRDYVIAKNKIHGANYRARPINAEKARETTIKWRKKNVVQSRLQGQIKYARKAGAEGLHTEEQWQTLLDLCGRKCLICGATEKLTRDHIIPLVYGGSNFIDNIQPLCHHCNTIKREISIVDYRPPQAREWAAKDRPMNTIEYSLYDLRNLDEHTHQLLVTNEVDAMLTGETCVVCGNPFESREEKDNAVVAGKEGQLSFAHEGCWKTKQPK